MSYEENTCIVNYTGKETPSQLRKDAFYRYLQIDLISLDKNLKQKGGEVHAEVLKILDEL